MLQHVQKMVEFRPFRRASINKQHLKERKKVGAATTVLHVEYVIRTKQHYWQISNSNFGEDLLFTYDEGIFRGPGCSSYDHNWLWVSYLPSFCCNVCKFLWIIN